MRIEELKVGMLVTRGGWRVPADVRFLENDTVCLRGTEIDPATYWCTDWPDGWIEVKPEEKKKKPSERIQELSKSHTFSYDAILAYLDEQSEVKP